MPATARVLCDELRIRDWDLAAKRSVRGPKLTSWVVDRAAFDKHLLKSAGERGVETLAKFPPAEVMIGEEAVSVRAGASTRRGRILLVAQDPTGIILEKLAGDAGGPVAGPTSNLLINAQAGSRSENGIDVIFGNGKPLTRAMVMTAGNAVTIHLIVDGAPAAALTAARSLCTRLSACGLIESQDDVKSMKPAASAPQALQMDHHVGKRTLRIGEAGGFYSSLANESIYPGMQSGVCAAEIADAALAAASIQDTIMNYRVRWREQLAAYLQMPNSDLPLLLPLVFRNERMCERIAHGILLGEQF